MPDQSVTAQVTINGKSYTMSPLRCKHLKQITNMLSGGVEVSTSRGVYGQIERLMPYVGDCIRVNHADFNNSELEELSLSEFYQAWKSLTEISGITITSKAGELRPATSTGSSSTGDSVVAPAGPTVM